MKSIVRAFGFAIACLAVLSACGGGGGGSSGSSSSGPKIGIFADSAAEGLTYVTGSTTGVTDAAGQFTYVEGQTVTFKVGGIELGTLTPSGFVTPISLVTGATNELHATVTNISKFLQTIDEDHNPANGIRITAAMRTAALGRTINFAQTTAAFDADANVTNAYNAILPFTNNAAATPVNNATAQSHMRDTLLTRLSGTYSGTYTGIGSSGTFSITITTGGVISGNGLQQSPSTFAFAVNGTVGTDGVANFASGAAGNATFTGNSNIATGAVSGNWTANGYGPGTFSGRK